MKSKLILSCVAVGLLFAVPGAAFADGCAPGQPCWERKVKKAPPPAPMKKDAPGAPVAPTPPGAATKMDKMGGADALGLTVGAGLEVLFFTCEDTEVAPSLRAGYEIPGAPLNVTVGVSGTRIDETEQFRFANPQPFGGRNPEINIIRVPFSLEYVLPVTDEAKFFAGGGPDIIHTNSIDNDTVVGGHLHLRGEQALTEMLALSVEGGYLWAEPKIEDVKTDLDSAFVGAHLMVKF